MIYYILRLCHTWYRSGVVGPTDSKVGARSSWSCQRVAKWSRWGGKQIDLRPRFHSSGCSRNVDIEGRQKYRLDEGWEMGQSDEAWKGAWQMNSLAALSLPQLFSVYYSFKHKLASLPIQFRSFIENAGEPQVGKDDILFEKEAYSPLWPSSEQLTELFLFPAEAAKWVAQI